MASTTTGYGVKIKYSVDGNAASGLKGIAAASDRAAKSTFSLKSALAAVGGVALLHKGKELLFDFNSEMERLKNGMTTVMQMNMHMPFEKAHASAEKLFFTFQEMAKVSPLLTSDFMHMASMIAPAIAQAGGGVQKLQKMTQGALLAGLAFNIRPDQMAMDIQEMFGGNVRLTSRTARQLLAAKNLDHHEFNAKSASERASITESILGDPALIAASERAAHTMSGEVSTIKDNIQIAFGEIGKPLMGEITSQFRQINTWIQSHPKAIQDWSNTFATTLKNGFEGIKSIAAWFMDHRELIMSLAKTFVMFKGAQIATNVFKNFTDGVAGLAKGASGAASAITAVFAGGSGGTVVGGFTSLIGILGGAGGVIAGLAAFAGALEVASHLLYNNVEADRKAKEAAMSLHEATGEYPGLQGRRAELQRSLAGSGLNAGVRMRQLMELEGLEKKLQDPEKLGLALRKISEAADAGGKGSFKDLPREAFLDQRFAGKYLPNLFSGDEADMAKNMEALNEVTGVMKAIRDFGVIDQGKFLDEVLRYAFPDQFGMPTPKEATPDVQETWKGLDHKDVNVTIQKVEVASEDPDRFVMGLVNVAENGIRHATQSAHTIAGGF